MASFLNLLVPLILRSITSALEPFDPAEALILFFNTEVAKLREVLCMLYSRVFYV